MTTVERVRAWEALDSRGRPTVACQVQLAGGASGRATVPSGASTGSHEAVELRDGGIRYGGRGVRTAIGHVNAVLDAAVHGVDASYPAAVDDALQRADPSPGFGTLGANAVLAVSLAAAIAAADAAGTSLARRLSGDGPLLLPMPMVNILSGGVHAGGAVDIQDVLVIPTAARSFSEAVEWVAAVRDATTQLALRSGYRDALLVAYEGGLGVLLESNRAALDLVTAGIAAAGFEAGAQVGLALDVAANQLYDGTRYRFAREQRDLSAADLVDEVSRWCDEYPIVSVEDVLAEDDWAGWSHATHVMGDRVQLIGDDLFATQEGRLRRGAREGVANAVLVKVNQNGLLSGTARVIDTARVPGYHAVVSARSGETEGIVAFRPRRWLASRTDQGRIHAPLRADGQVEPAARARGVGADHLRRALAARHSRMNGQKSR